MLGMLVVLKRSSQVKCTKKEKKQLGGGEGGGSRYWRCGMHSRRDDSANTIGFLWNSMIANATIVHFVAAAFHFPLFLCRDIY